MPLLAGRQDRPDSSGGISRKPISDDTSVIDLVHQDLLESVLKAYIVDMLHKNNETNEQS